MASGGKWIDGQSRRITASLAVARALLIALSAAALHAPGAVAASPADPLLSPPAFVISTEPPQKSFDAFLADVRTEARTRGIRSSTLTRAFDGLEPDLRMPDLVRSPRTQRKRKRGQPEFIRPPADYLDRRQLERLAGTGQRLAKKHADALAQIQRRFGVRPAVVLAIWGRETAFGGYRLRHDAIRALATQAWTGRRRVKFRKELLLALALLDDGRVTRKDMRSSWAGAMGPTQLLPSNVRDHGTDIDGDGRIDIWRSLPDALGAAAKSLVDNGWQSGRTWGWEVRLPASFDCTLEGPRTQRTVADWRAAGLARTSGRAFPANAASENAYILLPEGTRGPAFLMHRNFLVLKSYNYADLYALFVGHLADRIAGGGDFNTAWATRTQLPKHRIEDIQAALNAAGFAAGKVDGRAGTITRNAIGAFQKARGLPVDCYPSRDVWQALTR
ncbi:MAG: lytic murein transglycosylase [Pseudomonadota bacterium]